MALLPNSAVDVFQNQLETRASAHRNAKRFHEIPVDQLLRSDKKERKKETKKERKKADRQTERKKEKSKKERKK